MVRALVLGLGVRRLGLEGSGLEGLIREKEGSLGLMPNGVNYR